jgi:plastocyanin
MHPTGVASAAWVFAATSKTPFYVAGGLLAGWAVLVSVLGAMRPDVPRSGRGRGLVILGTFALAGATMAAAVVTAGGEGKAQAPAAAAPQRPASFGAASTLELAADPSGQLAYDKKHATLKPGAVAIHLVNTSPVPHNVTIAAGSRVLAQTKTVQGATVTAKADLKAGDYVFYCSVDAHRAGGMEGTVTVRP